MVFSQRTKVLYSVNKDEEKCSSSDLQSRDLTLKFLTHNVEM